MTEPNPTIPAEARKKKTYPIGPTSCETMLDSAYTDAYRKMTSEPIPEAHASVLTRSIGEQANDHSAANLPAAYFDPKTVDGMMRKARLYVPDGRDYLIRQSELNDIEKKRSVVSEGGWDWSWYKDALGADWSTAINAAQGLAAGIINGSWKFNSLHSGKSTMMYDTVAHERSLEEHRRCHWRMHQFQTCITAYTGIENPFKIWPNPWLPHPINKLQSGKNYMNDNCADFRLVMDQYCDEHEMEQYYYKEIAVWKQRKTEMRTQYVNERVEQIKQAVKSVIPESIEIPNLIPAYFTEVKETITSNQPLSNPSLAGVEKYKLSNLKQAIALNQIENDEPSVIKQVLEERNNQTKS